MVPRPQALLAVVVVGAAACGGTQRPAADPTLGNSVDLVLPSVDGGEVDLARYRGRPLVIHLTSTSSLDAQSDIDELRRARARRHDLALVEIVFDQGAAKLAAPWANASGIDWSVLLPTAEVRSGASPLGAVRVVPTTLLVDAGGRIAWKWPGALPRGKLAAALESLR